MGVNPATDPAERQPVGSTAGTRPIFYLMTSTIRSKRTTQRGLPTFRSHTTVGYLGVVVAAAFGDIRRMWPVQPLLATGCKASDAVSNPTERRTTGEVGSQEGSSPSLTAEQKASGPSAPLLNSDRVVQRERRTGRACQSTPALHLVVPRARRLDRERVAA